MAGLALEATVPPPRPRTVLRLALGVLTVAVLVSVIRVAAVPLPPAIVAGLATLLLAGRATRERPAVEPGLPEVAIDLEARLAGESRRR